MKQINKILIISQVIVLSAFVSITTAYSTGSFNKLFKRGISSNYEINLNQSNRVYNSDTFSSENEVSGNFTSTTGASFQMNVFNVVKNNVGWQSILPGGYFYNPITDNGWYNQIKGIQSISYTGNGSLELHYGWSIDKEEVIYTTEETLNANSVYSFTNQPSYIYLKNVGSSTVDITSFNISFSCSEDVFPNNNLKVLMIGNSFADDTVYYTQRVAASYGINIDIYDAYIAGCTVEQHYEHIQYGDYYSMHSMNGNVWNYQNNMTLTQIINSQTWDIITFQQASAEVGKHEKYDDLDDLVGEVRSLVGSGPKFYWYETWAYDNDYTDANSYFSYFHNDQEEMFDAIIDCYEDEVEPLNLFEDMIPAGTAVQNARTSYMNDYLSRDGKHMSDTHGRYLLALNFVSYLLNVDLDLSPCSYFDVGINTSFKDVAYEAIRSARKNPKDITASSYVNWEMSNYDLSGYTEIDPGMVGNSYWYCMDQENYNKRIAHVEETSKKYVSTNRFTSSTLPVGSLVFLKEGFGYRPEAWTSDAAMTTREDESYDNVLEITNDFWSGYQYRAFNIFKVNKINLNARFDQIFDSFHIFVPNAKAVGLKTKDQNSKASGDATLFTNNSLDISNYELLHLDPIYGFYYCISGADVTNNYIDDTAQRFVCTRPFFSARGDLPIGTVIIIDSGYNWRSDWWGQFGAATYRPEPTTTQFTQLDASFWDASNKNIRIRTFNVSKTDGYTKIGQNAIDFIEHLRIYVPNN